MQLLLGQLRLHPGRRALLSGRHLLLAACLAACGSSTTRATSDGGADGATPDATVDAGAADASTNLGFVTLLSDQSPAHARASATFLVGGPAYLCSEQVAGACTLYRCRPRPGAGNTPAPAAGVIQVTGATQPLTFTPGADGIYPVVVLSSSLWTGGETLTASAAGAQVPAFQGTVVAPHRLTIATPVVPAGDWTIDRAHDLVLTWAGGGIDSVIVTFGANTTDPLELECVFRASDGTGTVPAAGLAMLPAGDGYYSAVTRMRTELGAGGWQVTLRADSSALLPDARLVQGSAILQ